MIMSVVFSFARGVKVVVNENFNKILIGKKEGWKKKKINFATLIYSYLPTQEHRKFLGNCWGAYILFIIKSLNRDNYFLFIQSW